MEYLSLILYRQQSHAILWLTMSISLLGILPGCRQDESDDSWVFDSSEAKRRQEETCLRLRVPADVTISLGNGVTMKVVLIPAGTFAMGSPITEEGHEEDETLRMEEVAEPFYIGKTEVTQSQWQAVMATAPWRKSGLAGLVLVKEGGDYPASLISWHDAVRFCEKVSIQTGRVFRLPSEVEWEYACRAGTDSAFHYGSDGERLTYFGWSTLNAYDSGESYAHKVATKTPNAWLLFDMHGNVVEWCADPMHVSKAARDSEGRVIRGGSWIESPRSCRSAYRNWASADERNSKTGFRIVVEIP